MQKIIPAIIVMAIATASHATGNEGGKRHHEDGKQQPTNVTQSVGVSVKQSARAEARAQAKASARSSAISSGGAGTGGNATGGTGIGGNSHATGGAASATGGQVVVNSTGGNTGLTGRMVADVSTTSPITSTSCRNGITAGGSGNGWGGLIGFFSEDDLCEWRLLEQNYRATGDHDKANAIRSGMTLQRCEKLNPMDRKLFGDLCPKPAQEESQQNVAFYSAG